MATLVKKSPISQICKYYHLFKYRI